MLFVFGMQSQYIQFQVATTATTFCFVTKQWKLVRCSTYIYVHIYMLCVCFYIRLLSENENALVSWQVAIKSAEKRTAAHHKTSAEQWFF